MRGREHPPSLARPRYGSHGAAPRPLKRRMVSRRDAERRTLTLGEHNPAQPSASGPIYAVPSLGAL